MPPHTDRLYIEHFVANERAGTFYERAGFTVARIEANLTEDPALALVGRARDLAASEQASEHA